jgi:hypothetical protein
LAAAKRSSLVTTALQLLYAFSLLELIALRVGVATGLGYEEEVEEVEEEVVVVVVVLAGRRDEGLGLGSALENAERGVKFVFAGIIDALWGVAAAVGVEDSIWRRRDGVVAAGVALADAPKKLLKRSLGELS